MSKTLNISTDLSLPLEFITQTQAILARKRVGKSYTASVQAEEMLRLGQQVLVIDYTGAWWGLRAGRDGKADGGYPIHVFGGDHADVPLEERAGELIAAAAVKERFSAILDMTSFRKAEALRFLSPFLETLYRLNREPLHLFADEADAYAPQRTFGGDDARTLGAMNDIVLRGGIRGIGCSIITQRSARINKDVLSQCGILTCLRTSSPKDLAAVREWVEVHDEGNQAGEMMKSLPTLPIGSAWMWAPGWPSEAGIFKRIKIRQRETFDSGATPKPGQTVKVPKTLRPVDLAKLGETIKQTAEQVKANDPAELKKKLAAAEKALATAQTAKAPASKAETLVVEKPVITDKQIERLEAVYARTGERLTATMDRIAGIVNPLSELLHQQKADVGQLIAAARAVRTATPAAARPVLPPARAAPLVAAPSRPAVGAVANGHLPKGERAVLTAVAQYTDGAERDQLSVLTGYKRSSRDAYLQRLGEKGYVGNSGGRLLATAEGIAALGADFEPLPTGEALRSYWLERLPEGERRVLGVLIDSYPDAVDREAIDEATGYKRSSRDAYLQRLGSRRLVESGGGRGQIKAAANLF